MKKNGLQTAAFVIMIIKAAMVSSILIPLAWMIPMIVKYNRDPNKVTVGFKILTLLFFSLIAGILMLIDGDSVNGWSVEDPGKKAEDHLIK